MLQEAHILSLSTVINEILNKGNVRRCCRGKHKGCNSSQEGQKGFIQEQGLSWDLKDEEQFGKKTKGLSGKEVSLDKTAGLFMHSTLINVNLGNSLYSKMIYWKLGTLKYFSNF